MRVEFPIGFDLLQIFLLMSWSAVEVFGRDKYRVLDLCRSRVGIVWSGLCALVLFDGRLICRSVDRLRRGLLRMQRYVADSSDIRLLSCCLGRNIDIFVQ